MECMRLAAKQIDVKGMFGALQRDWERAAKMGSSVSRSQNNTLTLTY
jgi:hypothetical protein